MGSYPFVYLRTTTIGFMVGANMLFYLRPPIIDSGTLIMARFAVIKEAIFPVFITRKKLYSRRKEILAFRATFLARNFIPIVDIF
jgi:hypothetical protein